MIRLLFLILMCSFVGGVVHSPHAEAGSLKQYKKQKHSQRKRVDAGSCTTDFVNRCSQSCSSGDLNCLKSCHGQAPQFCEARKKRRTRKKLELLAKGASLGVGALGVIFDKKMSKRASGQTGVSPYSVIWNRASWILNLGGGTLDQGGSNMAGNFQVRKNWYGFAGNYAYLKDGKEYLSEADFGPTVSFGSSRFIFGLQPSVLVSGGNGVQQEFGGGLRTYTRMHLGRVYAFLDPLLGYINQNWQYHVKVGGGFRVTPNLALSLAYEYRDLVDLNDLDISQASLQSVMGYAQLRFN